MELAGVDENRQRFCLLVREIRGQNLRRGQRTVAARFRTVLQEARRRQCETTIQHLKQTLLSAALPQSHTQETVVQEIAALLLAAAAVAEAHSQPAEGEALYALKVSHTQASGRVGWVWMTGPMLRATV